MEHALDFERIRRTIEGQFALPLDCAHGPSHWERVERYGLLLAKSAGGDPIVVRLFALFHDSRRQTDYSDPEHGPRAAVFFEQQRGELFEIDDERFELVRYAVYSHTHVTHATDVSVQCCFDADRLDLARFGLPLRPELLNTDLARRIAREGFPEGLAPPDIR